MSILGDDVFVWFILLGLLAFVSLIISGLIFITEPIFRNDNIVLIDPNLGIARMAVVISWLSLPITFFMTITILKKILGNQISIIIMMVGLLGLLSCILYGLSILSMGLFQQNGVYVNNIDTFTDPTTAPAGPPGPPGPSGPPGPPGPPSPTQTNPPPIPPPKPIVYTDTFTLNCLKIAIIFSWLSISWNIYFFIKETS